MRQEYKKDKDTIPLRKFSNNYWLVWSILTVVSIFAFYLMVAVISFSPHDPSWSQTAWHNNTIHNLGGKVGAWFADAMFFTFGVVAYILPVVMLCLCWSIFIRYNKSYHVDLLILSRRLISGIILLLTSCSLATLNIGDIYYFTSGGMIGYLLSSVVLLRFDSVMATLILFCTWILGLTIFTGWSWLIITEKIGATVFNFVFFVFNRGRHDNTKMNDNHHHCMVQETQFTLTHAARDLQSACYAREHTPRCCVNTTINATWYDKDTINDDIILQNYSNISSSVQESLSDHLAPKTLATNNPSHSLLTCYEQQLHKTSALLPTIDLLAPPPKEENLVDMFVLEQTARLVETSLADYRVKAKVVGISSGPVITRFELDLAPGMKAARVSNLSRDLARSLSVIAVRVVELIPGKPYVGLELPNKKRQTVYLRDVLDCDNFREIRSPLALVLGKDIDGHSVIADLGNMPHLLVAGTTGSGKSVGVNAMILSILYKATPKEVRFIMIDPKILELSVYEGIPHLLTKVVTDMKNVTSVLHWCVSEMERRYKLMSVLGVRNLIRYNERIEQAKTMGLIVPNPFYKPNDSISEVSLALDKLPYIVVIIDEFADLIMMVGKKVEELIVRLAQKARAAGIHLVLATQRPSVDVITGLIKANIPTRIAYTVSSKIDSRTILDQTGAESLLGMGDMLYLASNSSLPVRVHGAFVRDEDVNAIVSDWKARGQPQYVADITNINDNNDNSVTCIDNDDEFDFLFHQVVAFVVNQRRVSISSIQRQFHIGYNRATKIIKQMELQGVISQPSHNGNREVLYSS